MKMKSSVYKFTSQCDNEILDLIKLDNWHCWLALLEDYSLICISVVATCEISWYLYPLAILIIGSRQRALATLLHEAAHQTLAKNKRLNFAIGTFFSGYLILQTMGAYRESHVRFHHGHFGDMNLDPDYKFAMEQGWYDRTMLRQEFVSKNIIMPLFLTKVWSYIRYLIQHRILDRNYAKETIVMVAYLGILASILTALELGKIIFLFWLVPYLTTFQIISWFIEMSEHYPLMQNTVNLYMSRNRKGNWLEIFLTGMHNENYHLVHHLNPKISFWNVYRAHQIYMQDENYAQFDSKTGGLFFSVNNAPSIIQSIINNIRLRDEMLQILEGKQCK